MSDERLMRRALSLARRGQGLVEPNPMVAAVIVRDGQVVARGTHRRFGGPHAEVEALADGRARGIDPAGLAMLVTLEPCSRHGKTPPCTEALVEARICRVVAAMADPFEQAAGSGMAALRQTGIEVEVGVCEAEARRLNEPYIKRVTTGLPWVIVKWAQTLDGKTTTSTGDSRWISGEPARCYVHALRARVDAIMVGIGTVLADDPELTARGVKVKRVARRVVVDPDLKMPPDRKLVRQPGPPVTVAVRQSAIDSRRRERLDSKRTEFIGLPGPDKGRLNLQPLLAHLAQHHQATNVLVEGGAALTASLLDQGLVDQLLVFVAPKIMGDEAARPAVSGLPAGPIADSRPLTLHRLEQVGEDVLLDYRVNRS